MKIKRTLLSLLKQLRMFSKFGEQENFQGKITIFKTVAISKVVHLALVTNVPHVVIDQLNKIQRGFIWNWKHAKIRRFELCVSYGNDGDKS